jgi:hypothetical protein
LTWEESIRRDLKDWSITKELAIDRREWKLAIHVAKPSYVSFFLFIRHLSSFCVSVFLLPPPFPVCFFIAFSFLPLLEYIW